MRKYSVVNLVIMRSQMNGCIKLLSIYLKKATDIRIDTTKSQKN